MSMKKLKMSPYAKPYGFGFCQVFSVVWKVASLEK